jgi:hypothetical protein
MANSAMDRRFQMAGQQLKRQESQREQQEKEALKRRFAATGSLGSGASIKAEGLVGEASSKRLAEGRQQVEMAKLGEQARQEEIASQRKYATSERLGGQEFQGSQRQSDRDLTVSEGLAGRTSVAEQNRLNRELTASEALKGREQQDKLTQIQNDLAVKLNDTKVKLDDKGISMEGLEAQGNILITMLNSGELSSGETNTTIAQLKDLFSKTGNISSQRTNTRNGGIPVDASFLPF